MLTNANRKESPRDEWFLLGRYSSKGSSSSSGCYWCYKQIIYYFSL